MPLNQLIAQGGTQIKSPIQRYIEAQQQMQKEQMNRLAIASTEQQMAAYPAQQDLARRAKEEQILTSQAARAAGPKQTTSARKQAELEAQGIPTKLAQGIAYGVMKVTVDPTSGDVMITDLRQAAPPPAGAPQTQPTTQPAQPTVLREGGREEREFDKRVTGFSKEIEKSDIVTLDKTMSNVEDLISIIRKDDPSADIPGFGATASIPDFAISSEGKELRQRVGTLFNTTLKDRSGAAVTSSELDRLKKEFGQGLIKTDQQLLNAIERFRGVIEAHKLTLAAGYDDDVVDTWQKRSGLTLREVKKAKRYRMNPETGKLEAQ